MEYKVDIQAVDTFYVEANNEEEAGEKALEAAYAGPDWTVTRVRLAESKNE